MGAVLICMLDVLGLPGIPDALHGASVQTTETPPVALAAEQWVSGRGEPGDVVRYGFASSAPWIDLQLHKKGGDASLRLLEGEQELLWVDSPASRFDIEPLVWQAEGEAAVRSYVVEVHCRARVTYGLQLRLFEQPEGEARRRLGARRLSATAADAYRRGDRVWREKSLALYRKALESWRRLGDVRQQARSQFALAVVLQQLGDLDGAAASLHEAAALYASEDDLHGQASVLNESGVLARQAGRSAEAKAAYDRALEINRRLQDPCGEARSLLNLGLLAQHGGQAQEAQSYYGQALERCPASRDPFLGAELLVDMAGTYDALGDLPRATELLQRAVPLLAAQQRHSFLAVALGNLGAGQRKLGDYEGALQSFHEGLDVARDLGDPRRQATLLNSLGHAYLRLGEPQRALAFLREALPLRRRAEQRRGEAVTLSNLGQAYAELSKIEPARQHYQESLAVRRSIGDRRGEAVTLHRLAVVEIEAGRRPAAQRYLQDGLELSRQVGDPRLEGQGWVRLAELELPDASRQRLGDLLEALVRSQEVLSEAGDREFAASAWRVQAQVHRRLGDLSAAQGALQKASTMLESIRADIVAPNLRSSFLARQEETNRLAVQVAMERHSVAPEDGWQRHALGLDEKAKARSLLERVAEMEQQQARRIEPGLADERQRLLRSLRGLKSGLDRRRSVNRPQMQRQLQQVVSALEQVESQLRRHDPSFQQLSRPDVLTPQAMQAQLDSDTLVIQLRLDAPASHLWAFDRHHVRAVRLPQRDDLEKPSRRLHALWSELGLRDGAEQRRLAQQMGDVLLAPLAAELSRYRRLVFVLDGALHLLPMGALQYPGSPSNRPLIADFDVVQVPSISVLAGLRQRERRRPVEASPAAIAIIADPVFAAGDPRLASSVAAKAPPQAVGGVDEQAVGGRREPALQRLPRSGDEARAIAALAPQRSRLYLGLDASRERILGGVLEDAAIVHFATHGQVDTLSPRLSGLSLSHVGPGGEAVDGHMSLHEIYQLPLSRAELVVLSGCRTALGRELHGEGLLGLTRGFMHAGSARVVASLWAVQDRAGQELMTRYYQHLLVNRVTASEALRRAQNDLRQQTRWQDPYYWAAFVHQGEWR